MNTPELFQVSTLQALALGYTRKVVSVKELLAHGDTGLGTFEDVNGEMIVADGHCYRAQQDGSVLEVAPETGVPFGVVAPCVGMRTFPLENISGIEALRQKLDLAIEEDFGLNSMHILRIDGFFSSVMARSEAPLRSHHVPLKEILDGNQEDFSFFDLSGTVVALYFPDYMDGINAPGWHFHFISEDRTRGGHVFDLALVKGTAFLDKVTALHIELPREAAFDTYDLKRSSQEDIRAIEQGKA